MTQFAPYYKDIQFHYDLSNDFFNLFLDPTRTYSCAYFERADMTLEQAQLAKIDLALGKCDLQPGMTLLDVGCGWGATMLRAIEKYDVNVIGLTLSENQYSHVRGELSKLTGPRTAEVRLQGWEEFDGKVDRIVSIGAFEHFRKSRYAAFFELCREILPADGRMLLHTLIGYSLPTLRARGIPVTRENALFHIFVRREIFPGAQLAQPDLVTDGAENAGFRMEMIQALRPHYARTLDCWVDALGANREEAVRVTSEEVYERYMKYLTGAAVNFRSGHIDAMQFTLVK